MQAGGRSLRLLSGVLGVGFCKLSKSRIAGGQHGTQDERKKDAGGGAGCRRRACPSGCSGAGFVLYMDRQKNSLYVGAAPHLLPFSSSLLPLLLVVLVVSCGLDAVADSRRDGMQAGGCCLLVADGRRGGVLVGKRGGRWPGVSPSAFALCPCPSACWAWCWRWRAGCLASSAGQGWRAGMGGGRGWGVPVLGGLSRPPGGVLSVILHKVLLENTALCRK